MVGGDGAADSTISLFSYGSGCQAEFMGATVAAQAGEKMKRRAFRTVLDERLRIDIRRYEEMLEASAQADLNDTLVCDPAVWGNRGLFLYTGTRDHRRRYIRCAAGAAN